MKYIWVVIFVVLFTNCKEKKASDVINVESNKEVNTSIEGAKEVNLEVYDFNGFKTFLNKKDDKIYIINFWATWCAPCVKELPYFEKINEAYHNQNVEVILVSLDFPHLYDSKLKPFIKEKNLKSKVIALDDADMNTWIPQIDKNWSGSIPATIIYNKNDSKFFEQSFTYEGLENEIIKLLN